MAESVFKSKVEAAGLDHRFLIESAGTAGYHVGEWPDNRTIATLAGNRIDHYSRARKLKKSDLTEFDFVLAMDHSNLSDILLLKNEFSSAKIELFRNYDETPENFIVPDPYYGDMSDFSHVYNIVNRCSENLLKSIIEHDL